MTERFAEFRCCAWRTVSYRAAEMAAARAEVEGAHPGDAIVVSCQRLEAYGFGPCECQAPDQLTGYAALERLAAVAAGLESVVLGEDQVMGQVRAAFRDTSGDLRAASDLAVGAARALRGATGFDGHSGHLLDKALRLSTMQPGGRLLVLGVGAMGKLIATRAVELGFDVTVAGRREPADDRPPLPRQGLRVAQAPHHRGRVVEHGLGLRADHGHLRADGPRPDPLPPCRLRIRQAPLLAVAAATSGNLLV